MFALVFTQENVSLPRSVPRSESGSGMGVLVAGDFFLTPDVDGVASSLIFGVFVPQEAFLINCWNMISIPSPNLLLRHPHLHRHQHYYSTKDQFV